MSAKKFYGVACGRRPGIYDNWPQAQAQVSGFAGARYKGFASRAEAEGWLREASASPGRSARARASAPRLPHTPTAVPVDAILVYSDGGARFNPGPGGYGIVIVDAAGERELSGGYRYTTNNRMELMGCIVALETLAGSTRPLAIHTDSQYVVNGITKGWAQGWRRRGWLKGDRTPALNADLWGRLLDLVAAHQVSFHWVRGHAGHPENERCDRLAVAAAAMPGLPVDRGYEGAADE